MYPDSVCLFTNGIKTLTYPRVEGEAMQFPWADYPFYLILSNTLACSRRRKIGPEGLFSVSPSILFEKCDRMINQV